jgi:phospholipid/cholesterol/gamma-HCH transport system substrate-binding protein
MSDQLKVGLLILLTIVMIFLLGWLLGVRSPFAQRLDFYVSYQFAGGIEVGSPVRVSGIKVGQVDDVLFFESPKGKPSDRPVTLKLSVSREATKGIRVDSRFFINIAGLIGERYIEVVPGSKDSPKVEAGQILEGVNPPRVDQLISQSFDLGGKLFEIFKENEGDIAQTVKSLAFLSKNMNEALAELNRSGTLGDDLGQTVSKMSRLSSNMIRLTDSMQVILDKANSPEGQKNLELLETLLKRLEPLDKEDLKEFFQEEGIRARIF